MCRSVSSFFSLLLRFFLFSLSSFLPRLLLHLCGPTFASNERQTGIDSRRLPTYLTHTVHHGSELLGSSSLAFNNVCVPATSTAQCCALDTQSYPPYH